MITKEIATLLTRGTILYHRGLRNKDGSATKCRVNGACKTWLSRPDDFLLPVKYGRTDCFYINTVNAREWMTEDPTERARREERKAQLRKRFRLSDDTPDCILRDRMLDEGMSESLADICCR